MADLIANIAGTEHRLPRLTPRDFMAISVAVFERRRKRLIEDLDESKVEPSERLKALNALREDEDHIRVLLKHCGTLEGSREVVQTSLSRNGKQDVDTLQISPDALVVLAMTLCNFKPLTAEEMQKLSEDNDGFFIKSTTEAGAT